MDISRTLLKDFAKAVNKSQNEEAKKTSTSAYGTTVVSDGKNYVQLDGSNVLTPVNTTADFVSGERVMVTIEDHTATITGNLSSPSARTGDVQEISGAVNAQNSLINAINSNVDVINSTVSVIDANVKIHDSDIETINSQISTIGSSIKTHGSNIETINSQVSTINSIVETMESSIKTYDSAIKTINSNISNVNTNINNVNTNINNVNASLDAVNTDIDIYNSSFQVTNGVVTGIKGVETEWIKTKDLEADHATINSLDANYADIKFANIDIATIGELFVKSGIIENVIVDNQVITGELVGVTIKGDLIEGGTVVADKLVIKGEDGLYYKLNTDGETVEAKQTEYNSLDGSHILAQSITATKINVSDLVAFKATIGGFKITDSAIHSVNKDSATNTSRGIYMDKTGQFSVGNSTDYLKFFKDTDNKYKLIISASEVKMNTSDRTLQEEIDSLIVGGRNYIRNSGNYTANMDISDFGLFINKSHWSVVPNDGYLRLTKLSDASGWIVRFPLSQDIPTNETYTISVRLRTSLSHTEDIKFGIWKSGYTSNGSLFPKTAYSTVANEWTTLTWNINPTVEDMTFSDLVISSSNKFLTIDETVDIEWMMLTKGNHFVDWTIAPEDIAEKIKKANDRIGEAETFISSNAKEIELRAKSSDVEETFKGYYTKTQADAQISIQANSISQTVSQTAINGLDIGGRNYIRNSGEYDSGMDLSSLNLGYGASRWLPTLHDGYLRLTKVDDQAGFIVRFPLSQALPTGETYTLTVRIKTSLAHNADIRMGIWETDASSGGGIYGETKHSTKAGEWTTLSWILEPTKEGVTYSDVVIISTYDFRTPGETVDFEWLSLVKGNKPVDWQRAPEDIEDDINDASKNAKDAQDKADGLNNRLSAAESKIQQLADSISMLVTDENGSSLMTQTSDGWTFSITGLQRAIDDLADDVNGDDGLKDTYNQMMKNILALQTLADDHSDTLEYVHIGTYGDEPCIELGESDSDFKVVITNTRIIFKRGANADGTYIDYDGLVTDNITVKNEIKQGGWTWVVHDGGNLGLVWKGE